MEPGDLIMNPLGKPHGSIGRSVTTGITSPAYWVLRLDEIENDSRYFHYLLRSELMIKEFIRRSKNLPPNQFDLPWEDFRDISIALPPIEEQRKIAVFLDNELDKINQLITMKKQTIMLNVEGFNSSRHKIVTGRDLSPLIETDIGWLDSVPKVWKKAPLRSKVSFQKGKDPARLNLEYCATHPGEYPVYSGQTENDGLFATIDTFDFNILEKALLIRTVGTLNLVGTTTLISGKVSLSQNCALILPRSTDINMTYLHYVLPSLLEIKKAGIPSDMQASLRFTDLSQFWLHWPTLEDQTRIAEEILNLEEYVINMNDLISESISSLEEYKNSLITQSVTGHLDITSRKDLA